MNQTTAFSPHLVCKLLDGRIVRFAQSVMDHWAALGEEMKAEKVARLVADINASDAKPIAKAMAREEAYDLIVDIGTVIDRCRRTPRWIVRHLTLAFVEAGGTETDVPGVLALIPALEQSSIADRIAMLPVVKGDAGGTEANPFLPGVELASIGGTSVPPSGDDTPAKNSDE